MPSARIIALLLLKAANAERDPVKAAQQRRAALLMLTGGES